MVVRTAASLNLVDLWVVVKCSPWAPYGIYFEEDSLNLLFCSPPPVPGEGGGGQAWGM